MIWITGNCKAGKTTTGLELFKMIPKSILLDGDDLRDVWYDLGLSKKDRWEQNMRAARLASLLETQGFTVILSTICPYRELRQELDNKFDIFWIKLRGGEKPSREMPYED